MANNREAYLFDLQGRSPRTHTNYPPLGQRGLGGQFRVGLDITRHVTKIVQDSWRKIHARPHGRDLYDGYRSLSRTEYASLCINMWAIAASRPEKISPTDPFYISYYYTAHKISYLVTASYTTTFCITGCSNKLLLNSFYIIYIYTNSSIFSFYLLEAILFFNIK